MRPVAAGPIGVCRLPARSSWRLSTSRPSTSRGFQMAFADFPPCDLAFVCLAAVEVRSVHLASIEVRPGSRVHGPRVDGPRVDGAPQIPRGRCDGSCGKHLQGPRTPGRWSSPGLARPCKRSRRPRSGTADPAPMWEISCNTRTFFREQLDDVFEDNTLTSKICSRKTPHNRRFVRGKPLKIDDLFEGTTSPSTFFSRDTSHNRCCSRTTPQHR